MNDRRGAGRAPPTLLINPARHHVVDLMIGAEQEVRY